MFSSDESKKFKYQGFDNHGIVHDEQEESTGWFIWDYFILLPLKPSSNNLLSTRLNSHFSYTQNNNHEKCVALGQMVSYFENLIKMIMYINGKKILGAV